MSKKKQEEINEEFSLTNIKQAQNEFNKPVNRKLIKSSIKLKGLNINTDEDNYDLFVKLYYEYILKTKNYTVFGQKHFFTLSVEYWKEILEKESNFRKADKGFIEFVTRKGKRPKTDRTISYKDTKKIYFKIKEETLIDYFSLMYSYIEKTSSEKAPMYSANYFFYDFVSFIKTSLDDLISINKSGKF